MPDDVVQAEELITQVEQKAERRSAKRVRDSGGLRTELEMDEKSRVIEVSTSPLRSSRASSPILGEENME